jgi:hypothetical protein
MVKGESALTKTLLPVALVLFIIIAVLFLISLSCSVGYCVKHPEKCGITKKEGYDHPLNVDHIGAYHMIGSVDEGPRFQLYHGAGQYIMQPGAPEYTGIYGFQDKEGKTDPTVTPETEFWCGYLNQTKCPCGAGPRYCSNKCGFGKRGCPEKYNKYGWFPRIMYPNPAAEEPKV